MPQLIERPELITSAGNKPKRIEEFVGRVNSGHQKVSVARMVSPAGWEEPSQCPQFDEITLVLRGCVQVECDSGTLSVAAGQAVYCSAGERVRYRTSGEEGAEYIAICLPAFSPETVNRES